MTTQQAAWLAEALEEIVADPDGFAAECKDWDLDARKEFLVKCAIEEGKVQKRDAEAEFKRWCSDNGFKDDNPAAHVLYYQVADALKELRNDFEAFSERTVEVVGRLCQLRDQVDALAAVLAALQLRQHVLEEAGH
jgi:hypothetical protein